MYPEISKWQGWFSQPFDSDNWAFCDIDLVWGPHSIDCFANYLNSKLLRFNSIVWNPGSEGVDSFVMNSAGENNYVCPPICLILQVLIQMHNCKASGTLLIPLRHSTQLLTGWSYLVLKKPSFPADAIVCLVIALLGRCGLQWAHVSNCCVSGFCVGFRRSVIQHYATVGNK